jgi:hypothetical protein
VQKDNQELKLVFAAINKVEAAAAEIGADNIVKETQLLRKEALKISGGLLGSYDSLDKARTQLV